MILIAMLLMLSLSVLFVIFGPDIVRLFGATEAVIAQAAVAIRISAVELLFMAWTFIIMGALRGAGDTVSPLIVSLASTLIFRLGGTLLLAYAFDMGLPGVWIATAADWAVRSLAWGCSSSKAHGKKLHEIEKQRFG
jgi:Na+-driven multidrug efflux pump